MSLATRPVKSSWAARHGTPGFRRGLDHADDQSAAAVHGSTRETATLTPVSSKKRSPRSRKTQRQGLSGNPQRRAHQLQERRPGEGRPAVPQRPQEPLGDPGRAGLLELAYSLAGGAPAEPWWQESHGRILARARALTWPSRLVDVETQACQIVGDEFYDRFQSPGTGLHPAQWLRALAEETGAAHDEAPFRRPE